jgi:hypothetical protein
MVRGRRLVHAILLALWHNMHAQRGSISATAPLMNTRGR